MSPQAREILLKLSISLAESEHLIFMSDCQTCDMDKDTECTGECVVWLAMDAMNYARGVILDELEEAQDA